MKSGPHVLAVFVTYSAKSGTKTTRLSTSVILSISQQVQMAQLVKQRHVEHLRELSTFGRIFRPSRKFVVIRFKLPNQPVHIRLWEIIPRLDDSLCSTFRVVRLKSARGQIVERVVGRLGDAGLNNAQTAIASALC